jgi:hypothetical protein
VANPYRDQFGRFASASGAAFKVGAARAGRAAGRGSVRLGKAGVKAGVRNAPRVGRAAGRGTVAAAREVRAASSYQRSKPGPMGALARRSSGGNLNPRSASFKLRAAGAAVGVVAVASHYRKPGMSRTGSVIQGARKDFTAGRTRTGRRRR